MLTALGVLIGTVIFGALLLGADIAVRLVEGWAHSRRERRAWHFTVSNYYPDDTITDDPQHHFYCTSDDGALYGLPEEWPAPNGHWIWCLPFDQDEENR